MSGDDFQWVRRGGVLVAVKQAPPAPMCLTCGQVPAVGKCDACKDSSRKRVHGSHAGFAQHKRRNEPPCRACSDAEKVYQNRRYKRGQMSDIDRAWCERQAVKWSWILDTKTNRT